VLKKLLLILSLHLLLTACGGTSQPATEITLDATDFAYSPVSVTIPVGEPVLLTLVNSGVMEHDFVIDKIATRVEMVEDSGSDAHHAHGAEKNYDLHFSAQPGATSVIQFTVAEPGTYTFYCSVVGHKEAGMLGELIVVAEE
jgi:uncharacterized cupredoxin-like copper-binding protein